MLYQLLKDAKAPIVGDRSSGISLYRTYQCTVTGTGPVSSKVEIQVSNDMVGWITLGTLEAAGNGIATDGFPTRAPWEHSRAVLLEISGTDAVANVTIGY